MCAEPTPSSSVSVFNSVIQHVKRLAKHEPTQLDHYYQTLTQNSAYVPHLVELRKLIGHTLQERSQTLGENMKRYDQDWATYKTLLQQCRLAPQSQKYLEFLEMASNILVHIHMLASPKDKAEKEVRKHIPLIKEGFSPISSYDAATDTINGASRKQHFPHFSLNHLELMKMVNKVLASIREAPQSSLAQLLEYGQKLFNNVDRTTKTALNALLTHMANISHNWNTFLTAPEPVAPVLPVEPTTKKRSHDLLFSTDEIQSSEQQPSTKKPRLDQPEPKLSDLEITSAFDIQSDMASETPPLVIRHPDPILSSKLPLNVVVPPPDPIPPPPESQGRLALTYNGITVVIRRGIISPHVQPAQVEAAKNSLRQLVETMTPPPPSTLQTNYDANTYKEGVTI